MAAAPVFCSNTLRVANGNVRSPSPGPKARRSLHATNSDLQSFNCKQVDEDSEEDNVNFTKLKTKSSGVIMEAPVSKRWSFALLAMIFSCAIIVMYLTYKSFPNLESSEKQHIKLPMNIEDAKQLGLVLTKYKNDHYPQVLASVFLTYVFLQTFAIPGSIFLSILAGYLFPVYTALVLTCTCSAMGATFCYGITSLVGRKIVMKYWPERVNQWCEQVDHHREHLLNYVIFLRITPFLPNWFINIASPVINVDLVPFTLGTFIGVAPPSFLAIQTGTTLCEMTESVSNFTWNRVIFLGVLALLSLLPVIFKKKMKSHLE